MKKLKGIDVSHYQGDKGFDPAKMTADFIIIKATESNTFVDKTFTRMADATIRSGKLLGLYHFGKGKCSAKDEAKWFYKNIKPYIGKAILILDWEDDVMSKGVSYAKEFCDYVTSLSGVKPVIYMNTSTTTAFKWGDFIKSYPYLWAAEYNKNVETIGYTENPYKKNRSLGGFTEIIRQYSSNTYLNGFSSRLDVNEAYITSKQWRDLSRPDKTLIVKSEDNKTISIHEAAQNIVDGKPGWKVNGEARKEKALSLGINPKELQNEINKIIAERDAKNKTVEGSKKDTLIKKEYKYYTVKAGDTFYKIARDNHITVTDLKGLNPNIKNYSLIEVGDKIRVQ